MHYVSNIANFQQAPAVVLIPSIETDLNLISKLKAINIRMSSYKIVKSEMNDHEEILDFMNEYFVPDEPINAAINLCEKGYR